MAEKDSQKDLTSLLPLTLGLWLGYLLALLLIDHLFYPRPIFPPYYYLINASIGLAVLALALWPSGRDLLGTSLFFPLVILLLSVVPVISSKLLAPPSGPGPAYSLESIVLRQMPFLLIPLILVAWQYAWSYVVLYSIGITLFTLGLHLSYYRPGGPSLLPPLTMVVIQTISFLVVGYFISSLMTRLKQANAQLTDYAATLEELTISRERNRMARELHDTLAHTLSALSVQLETVKAYWEVDPAAAQQMLDKSLAATRSGLGETRRALKSLRASPLDDLGLALALRKMAEETAARANLKLDLSLPEQLPALSSDVEQCMYRVAQEAMANAAHHANAHTLIVQMSLYGPDLSLLVRDDGQGFNVEQGAALHHFGLSGMRERAQSVGGELTINSQPGQGTTIRLAIQG
jgi:signal transduction histidine kinase